MSYTDFMKELEKDALKPVYLFYGTEMYLMDHAVEKLRAEKINEAYADFNWNVYDGATSEIDEILGSSETLPFFDETKVVLVKNAPFFNATKNRLTQATEDALLEYLKSPASSTILVFMGSGKPDKRKKLYKNLAKTGKAVEYGKLDDRTYPKWIQKVLKDAGKSIDNRTLQFLMEQTAYLDYGSEKTLHDVQNMLQKVIGYSGQREEITQNDIETMIDKPLEKSIFDMVDSLGSNKTDAAFRISHKLFTEGEPPIKVMAMVTRHFRLLLKTKLYMEEGYTPTTLSSKLKLPAFVVKKNAAQIRPFSKKRLQYMLNACLETEFAMKTGQSEGRLAIETLMVKLSQAPK